MWYQFTPPLWPLSVLHCESRIDLVHLCILCAYDLNDDWLNEQIKLHFLSVSKFSLCYFFSQSSHMAWHASFWETQLLSVGRVANKSHRLEGNPLLENCCYNRENLSTRRLPLSWSLVSLMTFGKSLQFPEFPFPFKGRWSFEFWSTGTFHLSWPALCISITHKPSNPKPVLYPKP